MKRQILCASCHEKLWEVATSEEGFLLVSPVSPTVPSYGDAVGRACPFCDQEFYFERSQTQPECLLSKNIKEGCLEIVGRDRSLAS